VIQKPDPRSAVSIGLDWGTRITSIGLEFALPAFLGFGLDRWWKTSPWMTLAGAFLGLATGMTHVLRLASSLQQEAGPKKADRTRPQEARDDTER
jgi:ATP synthase protein I